MLTNSSFFYNVFCYCGNIVQRGPYCGKGSFYSSFIIPGTFGIGKGVYNSSFLILGSVIFFNDIYSFFFNFNNNTTASNYLLFILSLHFFTNFYSFFSYFSFFNF